MTEPKVDIELAKQVFVAIVGSNTNVNSSPPDFDRAAGLALQAARAFSKMSNPPSKFDPVKAVRG
ncbi:TPA: hypothetical protein ACXIGC_001103 [Stenotrophomonas maltophilia]|uniref:hypothetical protein n=1 Tax=Stenotrophomonas maltophilia TaxID=40324 RepID=UPI00117D8BD7|nr:hypothetical protein [Stenotrophomonas maltophilia]MBH1647610.1 hypothetical protein [Stenotrophomonas maltophilia]MBH1754738.1 hypothetical protein [Stenotrophomonas maltophilia]MBH1811243.1 hypothetical protein [Stenotrophomonas maltophilia]MCO7479070.1 hypothetical protein [Stenotrophomonas maltophilia]HEL3764874.1 hypothetical protein [Stenotrophomonas maltophilia]